MNGIMSFLERANEYFSTPEGAYQAAIIAGADVDSAAKDAQRAGEFQKQREKRQEKEQQSLAQQAIARLIEQNGGTLSNEQILQLGAMNPDLAKIAVSMRGKESERQQKMQELIGRGFSEYEAQDIASGRIKVAQDARGNPILINTATGQMSAPGASYGGAEGGSYDGTMGVPGNGGGASFSDLSPDDIAGMNPTVVDDLQALEKAQEEKQTKQQAFQSSYDNFKTQYNLQKERIAAAREKIRGGGSTGLVNQLTSFIDSSPAGSLESDLEVLRGNSMLDAMARLKEASPTGASGLGNQTEKEGERLIASRGNLKGSLKGTDLLENLDLYEKNLDAAWGSIDGKASSFLPKAAPKRLRYNPQTGRLE